MTLIPGPVLVIDAPYIGHTVKHTMGNLAHDDMPTGVLFGFLQRVLSLAQQFETCSFIFCWDSKHSKRRDLYPLYKANRREQTEEERAASAIARRQMVKLHKRILPAIGFRNTFKQRGLEADDLIAQVCTQLAGRRVVIVSADHDLYQCLAPSVNMYNPTSRKTATRKSFRAEYGLDTSYWWRVKAWAGCPSDNVAGVPGIGIVSACKHIGKRLTGKREKLLRTSMARQTFDRNKKLVRLPFPGTKPLKLRDSAFDADGFHAVCKRYGMYSYMTRMEEWRAVFDGTHSTAPRRQSLRGRGVRGRSK